MTKGKPNKRYTPEFKIMAVETIHKEDLSNREVARQFEIASHDRVAKWERIYLEEGKEGYHKALSLQSVDFSDMRQFYCGSFLYPSATWTGYHFSNHTVHIPMTAGTQLQTIIVSTVSPADCKRNAVGARII